MGASRAWRRVRFFFYTTRLPPKSTLFPYTTLFRSAPPRPRCAARRRPDPGRRPPPRIDRKSTRLNSSHEWKSYAVFCLKKKTPAVAVRYPFAVLAAVVEVEHRRHCIHPNPVDVGLV